MINTSQFEAIEQAGHMADLDDIISKISLKSVSSALNTKNPFSGNYDSYGADMVMDFDTSKVKTNLILLPSVVTIINRLHYLDSLYINEMISAQIYNDHKLGSKATFEKLFLSRIKSIKE